MTLQHERFASYVHDGMTQLHDEHVYMSQKMDEIFSYNNAVYSLKPTPPHPVQGLPFGWPPASYYAAFPSAARTQDILGSRGAGPSGAGAADPGDDGAGPSTAADDATPME